LPDKSTIKILSFSGKIEPSIGFLGPKSIIPNIRSKIPNPVSETEESIENPKVELELKTDKK
jgi:hypothetical protein